MTKKTGGFNYAVHVMCFGGNHFEKLSMGKRILYQVGIDSLAMGQCADSEGTNVVRHNECFNC
jgi:hypothetical protein